MNLLKKLWSVRRAIIVTVVLYAINIAIMSLGYATTFGAFTGILSTLDCVLMTLSSSFIAAEFGCAVLWVCLSSLALPSRLAIYFAFVSQVALIYTYVMTAALGVTLELADISEFAVPFLASSVSMLGATAISVRLFQRRIKFVAIANASIGHARSATTIFQTIYLTTLVAVIFN